MWNPWNQCWLKPQPICCSMDIMDSIWNDHGMDMEWLIPYGFHMDSTDSIWNLGISTLNSMEQGTIPVGNSIVKNNVTIENRTLDSVRRSRGHSKGNVTAIPWDCLK
jgi:hypothetical protein